MSNVESKERTFLATMHSIETGDEKNLATFYIMNTSPNRLGWGVTDKALEEALPTLLGKTIGCGPDYKTDPPHHDDPMELGEWVSFDKPNGYALATVEITDPVALKKLRSGEWGPISVVIDSYKKPEPNNGADMLESFVFRSVDFVDVPAYPQAGFMNFAGLSGESIARARGLSGKSIVNPIELCASFYESQSNGQAHGSLNPEELRKMQEQIEELKKQMETLTANYTGLKEEYDELKAGLDKPAEEPTDVAEDPRYKELEDQMKVMKDERHAERVAAALDGRTKAGLVKDQKAEAERLGKLDDETLTILTLDAGVVAEKLEKAEPIGPKLKYTEDEKDPLTAAIDASRTSMFGSRSYTATAKETNQ